jgi:serine/threonine protein kinase/Tol biopolymer transport system component
MAAFVDSLPAEQRPADAQSLAKLLVRHRKLTKYQAAAIYQGKGATLVLGKYEILDKIGAGGMGMVYQARHRVMDRLVALKVLPPTLVDSPDAIKRFHREVQAAAQLEHTNIVTAYDADEADGTHFLVMQFVDGADLSEVLKKSGPLPVAQAVDCILQAARGLRFAHEKGVVHRDIKPANLLLSKDGTVQILDMGLARIEGLSNPDTQSQGLTQTGQIMGTVDYMSPEQAMDTRAADARADIYSLGCTLYRMLTGTPIYSGDTMMKTLLAHREAPIPSLKASRADAPQRLDAIFQRMVAKCAEDRPQTMAEVINGLETCLDPGEEPERLVGKEDSASALTMFFDQMASSGIGLTKAVETPPLVAEETIKHELQAGRDTDSAMLDIAPQDDLVHRHVSSRAGPGRQRMIVATVAAAAAITFIVGALFALFRGSGDAAVAVTPHKSSKPGTKFDFRPPVDRTDFQFPQPGDKFEPESNPKADPAPQPNPESTRQPVVLPSGGTLGPAVKLGPEINTAGEDAAPYLSADGLTLWFFSDREGGLGSWDLWRATRAEQSKPFGPPENLGARINSDQNDSAPWLSVDGLTLVFSSRRDGGMGSADLWRCERNSVQEPFDAPVNLGPTINSSEDDWSPRLSSDGNTLLFCSRRPGGEGHVDIWISMRASGREAFGSPVNAGPLVNSTAEDVCPNLTADGRTLLFASNRNGSHDLWMTHRLDADSPFGPPVLLGPSVNTSATEKHPCLAADGSELWFDRTDGDSVNIYRAPILSPQPAPNGWTFGMPVNLGPGVNTSNDDVCAALSPTPRELVFTSDRPGGSGSYDLWKTNWDEAQGPVGPPENLGPAINSSAWDGHPTTSGDGLILIFDSKRDDGKENQDIWMSTRDNNRQPFGEPVNLGESVNTAAIDCDPCLFSDGLTLLFASNRPGGLGDYDLWMARRASRDEPFGSATNLGQRFNTPQEDRSPRLADNGKLLLFTSSRPGGVGQTDMWIASRTSVARPFKTPMHLGPTLNTTDRDQPAFLSSNGDTLYFEAKNRPGGYGGFDLWKVPILSKGQPLVALEGEGPLDLTHGLVAHWTFDKIAGDVAKDASGKGHDGKVVGGTATEGVLGGAIALDGVDDYVEFPKVAETGAFSCALWVKLAAVSQGKPHRGLLMNHGWTGENNVHWLVTNSERFRLAVGGDPNFVEADLSSLRLGAEDAERWMHLACVYDAATGGLWGYVDGQRDQCTYTWHGNQQLPERVSLGPGRIGGWDPEDKTNDPDRFIQAAFDDVRIYDRVLSAAEVRALATGEK